MANIPISQIETIAGQLNDNDLILVSQNDGNNNYTSAKMRGSILKNAVGGCQFTDAKYEQLTISLQELKSSISSILSKVTRIEEVQNNHTDKLDIIDRNVSIIGNKIYAQELGEDHTLTLTYDSTLANAPQIDPTGGTYKSGSHVIITAGDPLDGYLYDFSGWYEGSAIISLNKNYSYTMPNNDVTLEAKYTRNYSHNYYTINGGVSITNNSSYAIGEYSDTYGWSNVINAGSSATLTYQNERSYSTINNRIIMFDLCAKNATTGLPYDTNAKIKLTCADSNIYLWNPTTLNTNFIELSPTIFNTTDYKHYSYTMTAPVIVTNY